MSADLLRKAATILRERAEAVGRAPWVVSHIDADIIPGTRDGLDEWFVMGSFDGEGRNPCGPFAVCDWEPSAAYIATMHPGVGLALADWLDEIAAGWVWDEHPDDVETPDGWPLTLEESLDSHALKVARLIVGADR